MAAQLTIGVDLGGTNIQCGLVEASGKVLTRDDTKTKADQGADAVLDRVTELVKKVMEKGGVKAKDIAAVGVAAAGAVDVSRGVVLEAPNLRWKDFPLRRQLQKRLDLPVSVENDVNAGAWGEYKAGAGKKFDDLLAIFIGTGIGGGLVLGGKLYHGHFKVAGEIGHTIINADAGLGRRRLEERSSRTSVVERIKRLVRSNHPSLIAEIVGGDLEKIRSKALAEAVKRGGPLTTAILEETAEDVGIASANAVSLLSLPCVVLGGGLTEALRDWWVDRVRTSFEKNVFPQQLRACKVLMAKLHDNAGIVGAGLLAREGVSR